MDFQGHNSSTDEATVDSADRAVPHLVVIGNGMAGCRAM